MKRIDRREALSWLAVMGVAGVAVACSSGSSEKTTSAPSGSPDCVLAPEMTEGPFWLDLNQVRPDITEGRPGTPLALAITVVDAATCRPVNNTAIDIWHADASGDYSGVDGNTTTFLRGIQMADTNGRASFTTIYPGWYSGRAVHIHIKVSDGSRTVHTGQLFFAEDVTDTVYHEAPYASRGPADVRNADDSIYRDGNGALSTLTPMKHSNGHTAAMTIGIKIA